MISRIMGRKKKSENNSGGLSSEEQIESYLAQNKDEHYNYEEEYDYIVSSGSLLLDIEMGGGISPGITRMSGASGAGKTSCALSFAKSFQDNIKDSKVVYFRSEGRLSKEMLKRSGVSQDDTKWFCYDSNIFESVIRLMRILVFNNDKNWYELGIFINFI